MKRSFTSQAGDPLNQTAAEATAPTIPRIQSRRSFAVARLVAVYVLVSGAWILLSDLVVAELADNPQTMHQMQTFGKRTGALCHSQ